MLTAFVGSSRLRTVSRSSLARASSASVSMSLPLLLFAGICACVWADAAVGRIGKGEWDLLKIPSIRSRLLGGCGVKLISILAWRGTSLCSTFGSCGLSMRGHGESSARGCHDHAGHEACYCGNLQGGADEAAARRVHWACQPAAGPDFEVRMADPVSATGPSKHHSLQMDLAGRRLLEFSIQVAHETACE
jgi:hypothetical protein